MIFSKKNYQLYYKSLFFFNREKNKLKMYLKHVFFTIRNYTEAKVLSTFKIIILLFNNLRTFAGFIDLIRYWDCCW